MASIEGDDPEAAFLKAMRAQQEAEESVLDQIVADNTNTNQVNQDVTSSEFHPQDDIPFSLDDADSVDASNSTVNDTTLADTKPTSGNSPVSSKDTGSSTPLQTSNTAFLVNPPNASPDVDAYAISAQGTPRHNESESNEDSGPFVIQEDQDDDVNSSTPYDPSSAGDLHGQTATLSYSEQAQDPMQTETANNIEMRPEDTTNIPIVTETHEASDAVTQPANDDVSSPLTQQGKRKRLAQDVVGLLEDRVTQDPRGDIDAWLQLINEHQRKGKLDDARVVYERFLAVFPTAVSGILLEKINFTTLLTSRVG